jgi:GT2 family glycosyltransferase/glycosyltransferase involved in cell wall biosynthesis
VTDGTEPEIAALVLNWHDAQRTLSCIEALTAAPVLTRIVVVDNEADGTLRSELEARALPRVELVELPENRGFSGGMNAGFDRVRGAEAVLVINNDALIDPSSAQRLWDALRTRPRVGIVSPLILNPDSTVQSRGGRISRVSGIARQNHAEGRIDYLSWACVMVSGAVLREVGLLDDSFFMYWEDVDYSLRVRDAGYELAIVDDAHVHHELSASAGSAGRLLASYYVWSLLRLGDKRGGTMWWRSRVGYAALIASRVAKRDPDGIRALRRGGRLPRPRGQAWRVVAAGLAPRASTSPAKRTSRIVALNGKWLSQPLTGTQRYATEIARRLIAAEGSRIALIVPADAEVPGWADGAIVRRSRFSGHLFEQLALPASTIGRLLVNLSGSSPFVKRRQIITLFDASVFRYGDTFSRVFTQWYRVLYRTARWRARRLLTISEFSRRDLAEVLRIDPSRLEIVPCGSDHFPQPTGDFTPPVEAPYVVVVGSLTERKNLPGTLNALARRGIRAAVVGAGGRSAVFADSAIPEDPHIVPLGRLTDEEIADTMAGAAAMVFPSRYEGFGLPIVEAQRVGCPVVCSTSSSLPEAAGDGALFFDADDPEAAADHVERLIADEQLRETMSARGRANALARSWDEAADIVSRIVRGEG